MPEDNKNKDDKGFSFIQEQITSKKKNKIKRMLLSIGWVIILAIIFGIVGAFVFCMSEPAINKFLGKQQDKKTVDFTEAVSSNDANTISPEPTVTTAPGNTTDNNSNTNQDKGNTTDSNKQTQLKPAPVYIEENANRQDLVDMYSDIRTLSNEVSKSIVTVTCISSGVDWFDNEYEDAKTTPGLIVANNDADLLVLVSFDRIKSAKNIRITFSDDYDTKAKVQAYDKDLNLAILAVNLADIPGSCMENIKTATLGESNALIVGTPVIALGAPNGYVGSMDLGIITSYGSSEAITDNKIDLFNTDISYNENGDGYIVNLDGKVIGIITRGLKDGINQKINTAIGNTGIMEIIQSMVNNEEQVYFGIKAVDMPKEALEEADITNGIYLNEVEVDSPALTAGLQSGDIISAINDTPVVSVTSFHDTLALYNPKDVITVTVHRSTKDSYTVKKIKVTLSKKTG